MAGRRLTDIAQLLGVHPRFIEDRRTTTWWFPQPVGSDETGELWDADAVIAWYHSFFGPSGSEGDAPPPTLVADVPVPITDHAATVASPPAGDTVDDPVPSSPVDEPEEPMEPRTYVAADEFGMLCLIPLEDYAEQALEAEVAYSMMGKQVSLAEIDYFSDDPDACPAFIREVVERQLEDVGLLVDGKWNLEEVWEWLVFDGVIEDDDDEDDDWTPTEEQLGHLTVDMGYEFYESCGLRDWRWAEELPDAVVGEFGRGAEGFSGDYFGFDWADEEAIIAALTARGHRVIHERDLGTETSP